MKQPPVIWCGFDLFRIRSTQNVEEPQNFDDLDIWDDHNRWWSLKQSGYPRLIYFWQGNASDFVVQVNCIPISHS